MFRYSHAACVALLALAFQSPLFATEVGVTQATITVGQSAPFSGAAAQLGIQMNAGTKAYFDHINAKGDIVMDPV